MRLDPADIDAIAQRVVLLMGDQRPAPAARLVDAAELASILGVDRAWVYSHAKDLKAIRLGGPRGRMRFDLAVVLRCLNAEPVTPARNRAPRGAKLMQLGGDLLPIDP
jgi:predicted DNA-binding transcriptional regulator AlpA